MEKVDLSVVLELNRRIEELREQHGAWLEYEADCQEWIMVKYGHQN